MTDEAEYDPNFVVPEEAYGEVTCWPSVVEHAILMSGGSMQVRPNDAEVEEEYPLAKWITNKQRHGGKVYRRTVIVVDDWREVPEAED